jgi:saccharopine dehydrogenase-like NADP-dependent oxidoreductase
MSARGFTVLIVGGYGTFGARLTQLLGDTESLTLLIAGRSPKKAAAFCAGFRGRAHVVPLPIDRDGDVESELRRTNANLVVDASGPFQSYAEDRYRLVNAALSAGIDYIDLADSSEFVKGVDRFDAEAKTRGIFVLSGVSTFPVLTVAVMEELAKDMAHIEAVIVGLVPSPYAAVGLNLVRAVAGYAGKPVVLIRNGARTTGYALTETRRHTIAPPGALPLGNVLFSLASGRSRSPGNPGALAEHPLRLDRGRSASSVPASGPDRAGLDGSARRAADP